MSYTSDRPALEVSECIANGWRKSPYSDYAVPVCVTRTEKYYFVGVELPTEYPSPFVLGTKYPFYAVGPR
jgi:hypothetical protein